MNERTEIRIKRHIYVLNNRFNKKYFPPYLYIEDAILDQDGGKG